MRKKKVRDDVIVGSKKQDSDALLDAIVYARQKRIKVTADLAPQTVQHAATCRVHYPLRYLPQLVISTIWLPVAASRRIGQHLDFGPELRAKLSGARFDKEQGAERVEFEGRGDEVTFDDLEAAVGVSFASSALLPMTVNLRCATHQHRCRRQM
jgi:hypothetical protein